ncbi:MAG: ABC transporter substrate-binding protein, partial [Blastochloris sp.]|nr:ABC transporter substrate-binding protein [Blastochloris sp.]
FNVEDRAAALIAEMEATLADVAQRVDGRPTPRIAILDYIDEQGTPSFYAAGLYTDLITRAGGTNVFADQQEQYVTISPEVVAERPVDVLAVMEWAGGISAAEKAEYYFSTFPNAPASQERRFVVLTNMDLNAGSGNANAVAKLARALHPEAFGTAPATETARYPVTIEQCGEQLTFTEPPQRVIATWQSVAEVLLALGLEDRIIGVYYGQFYPSTAPGLEAAMSRLDALTDGEGGAPGREVVVTAQPDFIYAAYPGSDFNAERGRASREDLAEIGAQIFGSSADCAADASQLTVETVYDDIRKLGLIFGVPERAETLIAEMQGRVAAVQARVAGRTPTPMIFYDAGEGPLGVYGSGLNNDMIRLAGGQNLFGDQPETYLNVGVEAFAAQPAEIFAIIDYEGFAGVPDEATRADFLFSTFPNLPAAQERRSVFVPGAAFAAGIRFPEAIEIMARAFHPDAFDAASTGESATYPVTIDNCGNTLTFTQAPERIAPLYPPVTEMLLLLGLGDRIVGIGGSGAEPVLPELQAAYQALPRLADSSAIPREVLLAAEPELVLDNQPDYFYDASQGFATREEIAAAGAQIYTLSAKCDGGKLDATMEDVYTDLRNLGAIFGVSAQAEAEIAAMQARIAAVTAQLDGVEPVSVIYYDAGEGPLGIFGPGTWEYVFNLAGATNAFSDLSESYAQISIEEVATRDADVIVVAGYEGGEKTSEERAAFIRSAFPNSTAVQNDRVFVVPYEYTNPGIQNVLGVEFLARALHPERFE